MSFELHEQLRKDCHVLGRLDAGYLLLLDNALVPWFILVPETGKTEFYQLDTELQQRVLAGINRVSAWVEENLEVDKLNVAMIGNKVPQMHIHIIGRRIDDYCWPGVVWASPEKEPYSADALEELKAQLLEALSLEPVLL
jgi:diadenosine tetraphosphate (Ap4A) HIT family hydrolase